MPTLSIFPDTGAPRRLLLMGSHPDDIEIGCAGTFMRLRSEFPSAEIRWVVLSGDASRAEEARKSAEALAGQGQFNLTLHSFRDGFFPYEGAAIKDAFEAIKRTYRPDLVFTHRLEDAHQDHRVVAELAWQTFRSAMIAEYEIPKYDGDLGRPNLYVTLSEERCRRKIAHLMNVFSSQRERHWFSEDAFWAILRIRGIECASPTGLAEAFTCRKVRI